MFLVKQRKNCYPIHPYLFTLRATAVPPGSAEARISYGNSVCLSRPSAHG